MAQTVDLYENNFLSIFVDAVLLYEAAVFCENPDLQSALVKSSVLSVNYALEAAANSFLRSVELTEDMQKNIDKLSTVDKFDFVLQWHTEHHLHRGDSEVQALRGLIRRRNEMVHPKIVKKEIEVDTERQPDGTLVHTALPPAPKKGQDPKPRLLGDDPNIYTHEDAKEALMVMTRFLNSFVHWWEVGYEVAENYLFQTWSGSVTARPVMFTKNQIATLIRNDANFLNIQFMGIHGMFDDGGKPA